MQTPNWNGANFGCKLGNGLGNGVPSSRLAISNIFQWKKLTFYCKCIFVSCMCAKNVFSHGDLYSCGTPLQLTRPIRQQFTMSDHTGAGRFQSLFKSKYNLNWVNVVPSQTVLIYSVKYWHIDKGVFGFEVVPAEIGCDNIRPSKQMQE